MFNRRDQKLYAEDVPLELIAAEVGTPCYVYSRAGIEQRWRAYDSAFADHPHHICYAVKANSNLSVLRLLAQLGSGFDIVSAGELERVLRAGGDAHSVVFSGVAKRADEMRRALAVGIRCFDVESLAELARLGAVAEELGVQAPVAIRVNPDVDAATHPYIATGLTEAKFGIAMNQALAAYMQAAGMPGISITGVASHIGSQILSMDPFLDAVGRLLELVGDLAAADIPVTHLDLGGGLGIRYRDELPPDINEYVSGLVEAVGQSGRRLSITLEPGRSIVGEAGVLLTRVDYLKSNARKNFAVVDAGMNDLLRPALYDAWQDIVSIRGGGGADARCYDVVGPVCETGDILGTERLLAIEQGDVLAVMGAGAYGWVMSSNYNSRPRPPEVLVDGDRYVVVRRRETIEELWGPESMPWSK
jgi:diaminopimelate decarboxylase